MKNRVRLFTIAGLLLAALCLSRAGAPIQSVNAQISAYGHVDTPYLDDGWHSADELVERGIITRRELFGEAFVGMFTVNSCGFAYEYAIVPESTDLVHVYVDSVEVDSFDGVGKLLQPYTAWYDTGCGIHKVIIGTRSVANFWISGIDVW